MFINGNVSILDVSAERFIILFIIRASITAVVYSPWFVRDCKNSFYQLSIRQVHDLGWGGGNTLCSSLYAFYLKGFPIILFI